MRRLVFVSWAMMLAVTEGALVGSSPMSSAATRTPGVSATTIRVGIPYVNLAPLLALGVKLNQGSYPDAYQALIRNINGTGGINGRKIVPYLVAVDPSGTAPSATACTQLTEDDQVFTVIAPLQANCYLEQHNTPTVNGTLTGPLPANAAVDFTSSPPAAAYDPLQLSYFSETGLFKGRRVGVFAGSTTDEPELKAVQDSLDQRHVHVVRTAVDDAPPNDQAASNQQVTVIAQNFQSNGVNEVIAVGSGSATWPTGLQADQSTYHPPWVATSAQDLLGYAGSASGSGSPYLANVETSSPTPSGAQVWNDPAIQKCVQIIKKAYPSDTVTPFSTTSNSQDHSYVAPELACENMALFTAIAKAAGKNLTVATFEHAGYALRGVSLPGNGGPVSFGPGRAYGIGTVFLGKYDPSTKQIQFSTTSATK